jgi:hypothetical protein
MPWGNVSSNLQSCDVDLVDGACVAERRLRGTVPYC